MLQYYFSLRDAQRRRELYRMATNTASKFNCYHLECPHPAIGSHVLQENGVLNIIAEGGHVVQYSPQDIFTPARFRPVGIGAKKDFNLIFHGFCGSKGNDHDSSLFRDIEDGKSDFRDYRHQLLFAYRALSNGIYQCKLFLEYYKLIIDDTVLSMENRDSVLPLRSINLLRLKELYYYKHKIEEELYGDTTDVNFVFHRFELPKIDVAASHMFSSAFRPQMSYEEIKRLDPKSPGFQPISGLFFVNMVPQQNSLIFIFGHVKGISGIVEGIDLDRLQYMQIKHAVKLMSDILVRRIDTWCLSNSLFNRLNFQDKIDSYMKFRTDYLPEQKQRPLFSHSYKYMAMPKWLSDKLKASTRNDFWKNMVPFNLFDGVVNTK